MNDRSMQKQGMLNVELILQDLSWKNLLVSTLLWDIADTLQLIRISRQISLFEMKRFLGQYRVKL